MTDSASTVKPVYFIADAHLGIESEALEEAKERDLLALLAHLRGRSSVVYLVGDIFDFWFEFRRPEHSAHEEVLSALRELVESGARIRFLGGNHDYWAGPRFEELTGATVHRTPAVDTHFGKKVFVAHGDGLPKGDWSYKLLKAVIRSPLAIAGFRLFSPAAGAAIGRWASGLSEVTEERILRALPAMKGFLESKLREGYDVAVVGHVHRQMLWESEGGIAVVVGDWMKHRSVIELTQDGLRPMAWVDGALVEETPAGS